MASNALPPALSSMSVSLPEQQVLQALLDATFLRRRSMDRRGPLPRRLRLRAAAAAGAASRKEFDLWRRPPIRTQRFGETRGVESRINECYLFHGTCWQNAVDILRRGFRSPEAPEAPKAIPRTLRIAPMLRGGIFLAECSSKADEYSDPSPGENLTPCTLLLCRALLGKPLRLRHGERRQRVKDMLEAAQADSVVVDLESTCHSYREFVFADPCQVLPEYLLVYERIFRSKPKKW
ncbi:unnamed protein product [Cladocopium goreaui]|uniref:Poly [ADP-ribose] polymerase n=1 Tax=Cladocopium goreaui TaxID=2562237 RepID=A0A9P1DTV4_9DINO|nr:unnamed protein product [Cladocopium goreaui]